MSGSENDNELKRTKGDVAHTLTKAGLSAIPFVGGPIAELMSLIWEPALSKRRDEWLKRLAEDLELLTIKIDGFKLEDLANNDAFITTTIQASQNAIRNHQKEKLDALRNAVLNSALEKDSNDDLHAFFLTLIERLTVFHIQILQIIASKEYGVLTFEYFKDTGESISNKSIALSIQASLVHEIIKDFKISETSLNSIDPLKPQLDKTYAKVYEHLFIDQECDVQVLKDDEWKKRIIQARSLLVVIIEDLNNQNLIDITKYIGN
jgi:hypothetical protein